MWNPFEVTSPLAGKNVNLFKKDKKEEVKPTLTRDLYIVQVQVYIVRVSDCSTSKKDDDEPDGVDEDNITKKTSTKATKLSEKSEARPKRSTKPKENVVGTSKPDESDGDDGDNDMKRTSTKVTTLSEKSETRPKRPTKAKENVIETSKRSSSRLRNRK